MTDLELYVIELKELLRRVESKQWEFVHLGSGICGNLITDYYDTRISDATESWPDYSGNWAYPIPATHKRALSTLLPERHQYNIYPKWEGKQLTLRISYLKHLIKELS